VSYWGAPERYNQRRWNHRRELQKTTPEGKTKNKQPPQPGAPPGPAAGLGKRETKTAEAFLLGGDAEVRNFTALGEQD